MTFANRKEASTLRKSYLEFFANKYIEESESKIKRLKDGTIDFSKLNYFKQKGILLQTIEELEKLASESNLKIFSATRPDIDGLVKIAKNVIAMQYKDETYFVQARLAAILFALEYAKEKNETEMMTLFYNDFNHIIHRNSIYKICRVTMRKGREDSQKSIVSIICNKLNFEFGEIQLETTSFRIISKHKEKINFKNENIIYVKNNINEILYNSARSVGLLP